MSTSRRFRATDLFEFNNYNISFYLTYLAKWPDLFSITRSPEDKVMGYIMGKTEGRGKLWHGHVTAVTVAPEYRRLGLAKSLMHLLETGSDSAKAYFVDLFVRSSNSLAIGMYRSFGYTVFRRVKDYYTSSQGPSEDAFDMRICLSIDKEKESIAGGGENNTCQPEDIVF